MSSRFNPAPPHFADWATDLVFALDALSHVAVDEVLFIEDSETETKSDNKKYMELKRIPEFVEDFLGQHFGTPRKAYAVIIYRLNIGSLEPETMLAHLAEQLLKIPEEGKGLVKPDISTFEVLAEALGYNWKQKIREKLPNLLDDLPPGYKPASKQVTLDELAGEGEEIISQAAVDHARVDTLVAAGAEAPPADNWQPAKPYVAPDNVTQLFPTRFTPVPATGTYPPE